jgi:glycosyltransferase involved in cell wall biosynthesis
MRVVVVTHFLSPYQAELFNAVAALSELDLEVVYLHRMFHSRRWTTAPLFHRAVFLDEQPGRFKEVLANVTDADLAIFNYYSERSAQLLLNARAGRKKPWCFWGERPGFQKPEWIGWLRRRCSLSWLHASRAPIWGIGKFAVERYQAEFGTSRSYCNLPYFSDLERFQSVGEVRKREIPERVFLFSGSLIPRKGVDLLGRAFVRLAREFSNVRLKLMGEGESRGALMQTLQPVSDQVEFLGFKDWTELPNCYAGADILCVPSRYDGWGLVVPEGLAAGLPVIGTHRMGSAIEFIETGRNGWLVPAGDEDMLFASLHEAALLPSAKLAKMSGRARESVSKHTLNHGADRFMHAAHDAVVNWQS